MKATERTYREENHHRSCDGWSIESPSKCIPEEKTNKLQL